MYLMTAAALTGLLTMAAGAIAKDGEGRGGERYRAVLDAVPHDPAADGGSNASGARS